MLATTRYEADTGYGLQHMLLEHWYSAAKKVRPTGAQAVKRKNEIPRDTGSLLDRLSTTGHEEKR
jgi:hypothetical protein